MNIIKLFKIILQTSTVVSSVTPTTSFIIGTQTTFTTSSVIATPTTSPIIGIQTTPTSSSIIGTTHTILCLS